MTPDATTVAALWGAVALSGFYHGLNPGMGWPLAVSAALMERRAAALPRAMAMLGAGHFLAMAAVLLPFAAVSALMDWRREIQIGAGLALVAAGVWLLLNRRHPRFLARVAPGRLILWSFLVALAHGAALMLLPVYLGLCGVEEVAPRHLAAAPLMAGDAMRAIAVAGVHTAVMAMVGGLAAWAVYRWVGLKGVAMAWRNLDVPWAASLALVGAVSVALAL